MELETLQNNVILALALSALAGLVIGALLTYLLIGRGPSKSELSGKLAAVEEEYEDHKQSVDKHFATTSELVNELTESYVKVYKHLSEGAESLGGVVDMRNRLTLDSADSQADDGVIEGDLAKTATLDAATDGSTNTSTDASSESAAETPADDQLASGSAVDPESAVSDKAVEEALSELEANATVASAKVPDAKAGAESKV